MIIDLYQYTDWANRRIFEMASGLSDDQLDQPRSLGLGSLRSVLFHVWAGDQIWLERWQNQPWREFPIDPQGISLQELQQRYQQTSHSRWEMLNAATDLESRQVRYLDMRKKEHTNHWRDLLVHVANHGIHHRSQILQYLKQFGRTTPGGLDYLFYKIAHPSVSISPESANSLSALGLAVSEKLGRQMEWQRDRWQEYFAYHDWANAQLWPLLQSLDSNAAHRDFAMGVGTIHKTVCHLRDAENWWLGIWAGRQEPFPKYDPQQTWETIKTGWQATAEQRNQWVEKTDATAAARVLMATPAKTPVPFRVAESMLQLCGHGTHHRAQLINMLRQLDITAPPLDYVVWARLR